MVANGPSNKKQTAKKASLVIGLFLVSKSADQFSAALFRISYSYTLPWLSCWLQLARGDLAGFAQYVYTPDPPRALARVPNSRCADFPPCLRLSARSLQCSLVHTQRGAHPLHPRVQRKAPPSLFEASAGHSLSVQSAFRPNFSGRTTRTFTRMLCLTTPAPPRPAQVR